jgi:hypothetical protein
MSNSIKIGEDSPKGVLLSSNANGQVDPQMNTLLTLNKHMLSMIHKLSSEIIVLRTELKQHGSILSDIKSQQRSISQNVETYLIKHQNILHTDNVADNHTPTDYVDNHTPTDYVDNHTPTDYVSAGSGNPLLSDLGNSEEMTNTSSVIPSTHTDALAREQIAVEAMTISDTVKLVNHYQDSAEQIEINNRRTRLRANMDNKGHQRPHISNDLDVDGTWDDKDPIDVADPEYMKYLDELDHEDKMKQEASNALRKKVRSTGQVVSGNLLISGDPVSYKQSYQQVNPPESKPTDSLKESFLDDLF